MREYQYGCTFYEKKYSHTGIFSIVRLQIDAAHCSVTSTNSPQVRRIVDVTEQGRRPQTPGACPIRSRSSGTLGIFGCQITVYLFMRKHERVNRYEDIFVNMLTFNPFYGIVVMRSNMLVWARVNS